MGGNLFLDHMPRRFTTSDKWDDNWYRSLTPGQKCAWEYLITKCDATGVWRPDFDLMSFCIGEKIGIEIKDILNNGKVRIKILKNEYWHIVDFIFFQNYSGYNPKNKAHIGIMRLLREHVKNGYQIDLRFMGDISIDTSIDTSLNSISKGKGNGKSKGKDKDETSFLENLKKTYTHIDLETELKKMDEWLLARPGRKKTKRFVIGWLNRVEIPMSPMKNQQIKSRDTMIKYQTNPEQQVKVTELIHKTATELSFTKRRQNENTD